MTVPSFIKKSVDFIYEKFAKNTGSSLLWVGILSWAASCVNQTVAIVINDKIPNKQKKFMIPQEITDGIVNIALFALFTRSFTKFGEKMVESGKLATKDLRNFYKNTKFNDKSIESLIEAQVDGVSKKGVSIKENLNIGKVIDVIDPKSDSDLSKKYAMFRNGVSFTFSTIGSVIACDFVTPFVRNKIASSRQKNSLQKEQIENDKQQALLQRTNFQQPLKQPLNTYSTRLTTPGGGMKI